MKRAAIVALAGLLLVSAFLAFQWMQRPSVQARYYAWKLSRLPEYGGKLKDFPEDLENVLSRFGKLGPAAQGPLADMIRNRSLPNRSYAMRAFVNSAPYGLKELVIGGLDDPNADVRLEAIRGCGEMRLTEAAPRLARFLDDPSREVRVIARDALRILFREHPQETVAALDVRALLHSLDDRMNEISSLAYQMLREKCPGALAEGEWTPEMPPELRATYKARIVDTLKKKGFLKPDEVIPPTPNRPLGPEVD